MRLVYLGTPEAAVPPLRALVDDGHDVLMVVSQPDRKRGRGGALLPSPVKAAASELGLPVTEQVKDVLGIGAELGVVVAFGRLVRPHVLAEVPMINVHFSLLPRWRGAAPVERAILAGDPATGVCIMQLEEGLDTGPVYASHEVPIGPDESAEELRAELVRIGTDMLVAMLHGDGPLPEPVPQAGEATYASKIDPAELRLVWTRPARELARVVRLGGAWTTFRGKRLKVVRARVLAPGDGDLEPGEIHGMRVGTGDGALELLDVQPEGAKVMPAKAWASGARLQTGERMDG